MIAIDNTLVDHAGKLIDDVGWFWDHADERCVIVHDYVISNYVTPSGAHYPIEWRRFRKENDTPLKEFRTHTELAIELIDDAPKRNVRRTKARDNRALLGFCATSASVADA